MERRSAPASRFGVRALAIAVALAAAAPAARADSLLDRPAPEPAVTKWLNGSAPPAWRALDGRCALLELLDPDDLVCQGLVSRTVEIAARAKERRLVVASVAVGAGAGEARAAAFAKEAGITWPLGLDRQGETMYAAGTPNLPRYLLVAPDGRVMWEGSPGALDEATLAGFVERARLWRPADVAKALRPAAEQFVRGKYGAAVRKAEEAVAETEKRRRGGLAVEGTEERDAALVKDAVRAIAEIRLGIAAGYAKERWSLDAQELLEGMAGPFAGTEWEGKVKDALAAIAGDKRAQAEIGAMKRLRDVQAGMRPLTRRSVQKAVEALEDLLRTTENLRTGERIKAERARLARLLEGL